MKFFIQLIFFGVALLLTFIGLVTWFAIFQDATPQGLFQVAPIDSYTEEQMDMVFIGGLACPILAIMIYFVLWKTNFFTRNKA